MKQEKPEPLMTIEEAAAYLRMEPRTVQKLARRRKIPYRRVPGKKSHYRFCRAELDECMTPRWYKK